MRHSGKDSPTNRPGQRQFDQLDPGLSVRLTATPWPPRGQWRQKLWDRWDRMHGLGQASRDQRLQTPVVNNNAYVIAVINQKGGTGKTTTTINLSAALAYLGHRTLMVDLDPQAHTTIGIGVEPDSYIESMAEVMSIPRKSVTDILLSTYINGLDVAPAHIHLAHVAEQIYTRVFRETILAQALSPLEYEFILIDCPPSLGVLTINALYACDFIIIPCQISRYSLDGLADLLTTIEMVKNVNIQDLFKEDLFRVLLTMYDHRNRVTNQYILDELRPYREKTFATMTAPAPRTTSTWPWSSCICTSCGPGGPTRRLRSAWGSTPMPRWNSRTVPRSKSCPRP
ncbi:MAG: AAA family ATPase [Deltaproteobacteria bacterium]|nr:AAA family ATPase [Deltaproteobacteria bacterium]